MSVPHIKVDYAGCGTHQLSVKLITLDQKDASVLIGELVKQFVEADLRHVVQAHLKFYWKKGDQLPNALVKKILEQGPDE